MSSIDEHVGARLRQHRRLSRLSVDDVATVLGIDRAAVRELEEGRARASATQIRALCSLLRFEPADIYDGWPATE